MIGRSKAASGSASALWAALLLASIGCRESVPQTNPNTDTTLNIGFGLTTGASSASGIRNIVSGIALEGLLNFSSDGRPQPRLAEKWSASADGRVWSVSLRRGVRFHNGQPVTAAVIREVLLRSLPANMGLAFQDVEEIKVAGDHELEFVLKRRSTFLLEGLDVLLAYPGEPSVGIGPFSVSDNTGQIEMRANESYYGGKPSIDRIVFQQYDSVRSAWAEMLRGRVDMLYEVGVDALDLIQGSKETKTYTFERPFTYVAILNTRRPALRDPALRRALNAAIDRDSIVSNVFLGNGSPAEGPVWPKHWAYDPSFSAFRYEPQVLKSAVRFSCLFGDSSFERLALTIQRQLQAIGVQMDLELTSVDKIFERVEAGNFDAILADSVSGPTLLRPSWFWRSGSSNNWGKYNNPAVDAALDAIRAAADDAAYRSAVAAFQRAIVDDPPAIFLTWSQRARAVSSRFDVPVEPGRDILSTLRLWHPASQGQLARQDR
jgi:peptide/nickel transport system substrate-binding protein